MAHRNQSRDESGNRPGGNRNPYPRQDDRRGGCDNKNQDGQRCGRSGHEHDRHWSGTSDTWEDRKS